MERLNDRALIINIIKNLIQERDKIFELIVTFTMATEFKELGNTFEIKDQHNFTLAHFADSENTNVVLLVDMCHKLDKTIFDLIKHNEINENDLN